MKRIILYSFGVVFLVAVVGYGSATFYGQLKSASAKSVTCNSKGATHIAVIKNNQITPSHTTGKLCDTLTIQNTDDVLRYIAFGRHDEHQPYDGITEKTLSKGQEFTVTLNEPGDYKFHDHLHDEVAGTFTVQR